MTRSDNRATNICNMPRGTSRRIGAMIWLRSSRSGSRIWRYNQACINQSAVRCSRAELSRKPLTTGGVDWHGISLHRFNQPNSGNRWLVKTRGVSNQESHQTVRPTYSSAVCPAVSRETGVLRSPQFRLPKRLQFDLCGHRGFPQNEASDRNSVRLVLAADKTVIRTAYPPRNDMAQRIDWDLSEWQGQEAVFELVDGLDESAYAWLAVSRFEPKVIQIPPIAPSTSAQRQILAAGLIGELQMADMSPWLADQLRGQRQAWPVRAASARALTRIKNTDSAIGLIPLISENSIPVPIRERICQSILRNDDNETFELIGELFRTLPLRHQATIAQQMSSNRKTARSLLKLVQSGHASARLLQVPVILEQLKAAVGDDSRGEIEQLVERLPPLGCDDSDESSQSIARLSCFRSRGRPRT